MSEREALEAMFRKFAAEQRPLGVEFERAIFPHLESLYEYDEPHPESEEQP